MKFELTILGVNSAMFANGRHLTAQILNVQEDLFLIDCGEGTQLQLLRYKIKPSKIKAIFISHLHGDHFFGLIGFLMSMGLNKRTEPLAIFSPPGLKAILEMQLKVSNAAFSYPVSFYETDPLSQQKIYETALLEVFTIPLKHRIPCHGFLFKEKGRARKMLKSKIKTYDIPFSKIPGIKAGNDFETSSGKIIPNNELTISAAPIRSYAFCSDTVYSETLIPQIKGVDLLYHEATFTHDLLEHAQRTMHTTALQAGQIAKKAEVGALIIGHFSSRYNDLEPLEKEAKSVFDATLLAQEGRRYNILYQTNEVECL